MRILIAAAVLVVAGMVGLVVHTELGKPDRATAPTAPGAKIATISRGEAVDIDAHAADGVWTVVEFTADW